MENTIYGNYSNLFKRKKCEIEMYLMRAFNCRSGSLRKMSGFSRVCQRPRRFDDEKTYFSLKRIVMFSISCLFSMLTTHAPHNRSANTNNVHVDLRRAVSGNKNRLAHPHTEHKDNNNINMICPIASRQKF